MNPAIRYARNKDGQYVAYQVSGSGPLDIVFIPDWVTNLEVMREEPTIAAFLDRLATFGRLVCFDKRGSGLSDPVPLGAIPTPEEWMDDVLTVLDALGSPGAALFGHGEGGPMAMLFAATNPNRTTALVLADSCARRVRADDYPHGIPREAATRYIEGILRTWGTGMAMQVAAPDLQHDPQSIARRARLERLAMSPGQFASLYPPTYEIDVRDLLPTIQVPTLVLHRADNPYIRCGNGRYLAEHIAGATFHELPGAEHFFHAGESATMLDLVQEFLTGTREAPDVDRVLATVLFTDIVDATGWASRLGDREWRSLLDRHHAAVQHEIARFRGQVIDTAGDGFFATFDGPGRGVRCALAIRDVVRPLGLEIRAGLHTGEVELMSEGIGGIAVHIGARIMALAGAGQVFTSRTVRDLVAGSGLQFAAQGSQRLKGVDGSWELFSAS
jgi:class 3 adenylate cyclase